MIRYRYRSTFVIVMAIVRVALIVVRVPSMAKQVIVDGSVHKIGLVEI